MEDYKKKYEQALERAKGIYNETIVPTPTAKGTCEYIFPELCDSEDEKIRKALKEAVCYYWNDDTQAKLDCLAWLEKQGEILESIKHKEAMLDCQTCANYKNECFPDRNIFKCSYPEKNPQDLDEKQGEQNHKEKVDEAMRELEEKARAFSDKYKGESSDEILAHMRGEQKSSWGEENSCYYDDICEILINLINSPKSNVNKDVVQKDLDWLRSVKKSQLKSTWSEEDEKMLNLSLINLTELKDRFGEKYGGVGVCINWLKTIKDIVQPIVEWKHENTGDLTDFENAMMHIGESFFGKNAGLNPNDTNTIKEQANILSELVQSKEWSEEDEKYFNVIYKELESYIAIEGYYTPLSCADLNWLKSLKERMKGE